MNTPQLLTADDVYLFREGTHYRLYEMLGGHCGAEGSHFAVWAPNAEQVAVIGKWNAWNPQADPLTLRPEGSGIWEGYVPGALRGMTYKYHIVSRNQHYRADKCDPFAFSCETPPATASRLWTLEYTWQDQAWMARRARHNALDAPWSIYEMHVGSWRRVPEDGNRPLSYRELAAWLPDYLSGMGFTHVEFMPLMEHPFYGSWGYQVTGFFAPSARYGTPQDLMYLIDRLHQQGIGVILDWVPSHFPVDGHGLAYFDGTYLYEHADPKRGYHPEWSSAIFNYGRHEVRAFLINSALFWLEKYHIDALRVDAVASMLHLDYGRSAGEWVPNRHGGREDLEAIQFLRELNGAVYQQQPDVQTIAEESTAWPLVSRPTYIGGLGFGMKWNMGWMHDTLDYFERDPVHRKYHQNQLTVSIWYAFYENFVLALSHDEVVYGKRALLAKMPGDDWRKFANLRLLLGYMYSHPGKKLLFMGVEFGQWNEWYHETSLDWDLLAKPEHRQMQRWVRDLNLCYQAQPALWQRDFEQGGFRWLDFHDAEGCVLSYFRYAHDGSVVLVVCHFSPEVHHNYRLGVPIAGVWEVLLNSDASCYGGSGVAAAHWLASAEPAHQQAYSLQLSLPPLGMLLLRPALSPGVMGHGDGVVQTKSLEA